MAKPVPDAVDRSLAATSNFSAQRWLDGIRAARRGQFDIC